MFSYRPHVLHFLLPVAFAAAGQYALGTSWRLFGIFMYVLSAGIAFVIGYAIVKESQWQHSGDHEVKEEINTDDIRNGEPVKIIMYDTPNNIKYFDLPATQEQLKQLVPALLNGDRFTVARWSGRNRPFSRDGIEHLREVMLARKWIERVNTKSVNDGFVITTVGEKALRRLHGYLFPTVALPSPTDDLALPDPTY